MVRLGLSLARVATRLDLEEGLAVLEARKECKRRRCGTERYKFDWARSARELSRVEAYPPSLRGRVHGRLAALDRRARRVARGALVGISRWSS